VPSETHCHILSDALCQLVLRDTFTVVLAIWVTLQLVWVTMLLVVQLVQIARAQTTFESMGNRLHPSSHAAEAIASALTSGATTMSGAQIDHTGRGPNPATISNLDRPRPKREGCFSQWQKLLGLDSFVATAAGGVRSRKRSNPWSRGLITNCKDFWCDPAPYFRRREAGAAMLGGEIINYTRIYETPPRMKAQRPRQDDTGAVYHIVGDEDEV
jgi:palmitoyltransferase ZDHHC13/17